MGKKKVDSSVDQKVDYLVGLWVGSLEQSVSKMAALTVEMRVVSKAK